MSILDQFIIAAAAEALHDWFDRERSRTFDDIPKWVKAALVLIGVD